MFSVPSPAGEAGEKVRIRIRADENPSRNLSASLAGSFLCSSSFSSRNWRLRERNNFSTLPRECRELGHEDTPPRNGGEACERLLHIFDIRSTELLPWNILGLGSWKL